MTGALVMTSKLSNMHKTSITRYIKPKYLKPAKEAQTTDPFNLEHFFAGFIILIIGTTLSGIVFTLELLAKKKRKLNP